jgi:microcystin-dependent protein
MSFFRAQRRAINTNTYYDNRLSIFTNPPIRVGDLCVEKNETVGGNLDICGNLTVGQDLRAQNFYASGNYYLNNYVLIPAGTIIQSAAVVVPDGWLNCDGSSLLCSAYAGLFGAIQYTYGGSGLNFNVPDMRGRVGIGAGAGAGLTARTLGSTGGEETHTLTVGEMPSHSHNIIRRLNPDDGAYDTNSTHASESSAATTDRDMSGNFSTFSAGSSTPHNNIQPFVVIRNLIKY